MVLHRIKSLLLIVRFFMLLLHTPLAAGENVVEPSAPAELTIGLWNVENFFDTEDTPGKKDQVVSETEYKQKVADLKKVIDTVDADIIGLCEVENIAVLADLAEKCGYPYYYLAEGNDPRGIDVAMLSRYPLIYTSNKDHPTPYKENKRYKFSRDCVAAAAKVEGGKLYILLTHLKSMAYDDGSSEKKRIAQAKGVLDIISDIYKKSPSSPMVLVMGDLNSNRHSPPLDILQKAGLINLNYKMNRRSFYTSKYKGKKQDLDYMLMNSVLFENCTIKSYKTVNTKEVEKTSDHYPVVLKIRIKKR